MCSADIAVYFRVEEAILWVHRIAGLLDACRTSVDIEPDGFDTSADFLPLLATLLRFPPIEVLFTQTSLGKVFLRRHSPDGENIMRCALFA